MDVRGVWEGEITRKNALRGDGSLWWGKDSQDADVNTSLVLNVYERFTGD